MKFIKITSTERQMELFAQYAEDESVIDWKSMFENFQDYRKKVIEQSV